MGGEENKEVKEAVFTPEQQAKVDAIVQERLSREKAKYADYETMKQKLAEFERLNNEKAQKELEAQKEYEKLKEGWIKEKQDLTGVIAKKDNEIIDTKINYALMSEITKQNAYIEESIALLKQQAVFKDGNIFIKGKDINGLEVLDSVEEGVKKFLTQRPHLVKATKRDGGGTGANGTPSTGGQAGVEDLNTLNAEFIEAQGRRDTKKMNEIRTKIKAALTAQGVRLNS